MHQRQHEARTLPRDRGRPIRYAALGDSTVFGYGASGPDRSYVGHVAARLRAIYPQTQLSNLGVNGATAADVRARQLDRAAALRPDLVTLSVGPNDITGGRSPEAFGRDMAAILGRLVEETSAVIVVNLIPDLAVSPLLPPELRALATAAVTGFNAALRGAAPGPVTLVDLYLPSQREVPRRPELLGGDYYHPSDEGYARWAEVMWRGIAPAIPGEAAEGR